MGFRLILRRDSDEQGAGALQPFVLLDDSDQFARTYLMVLTTRAGEVIGSCALKMQRSEYAIQRRLGHTKMTVTNPEIEARWIQERSQLLKVQADGPRVPAVFDITAAGSETSAGTIPPHLFCKHRQVLFVPRSPVSAQRLQVCRDDALLAKHGLPTYAGSLDRFLYAPADVEPGKVAFFSLRQPTLPTQTPVHTAEELCGAQGQVVSGSQRIAKDAPLLHEELRHTLPCYECTEAKKCYPPKKGYALAVERLVPLNFYDAQVLCTELGDLTFDQCSDLMGGRRADEVLEEDAQAPQGSRRRMCFFEGDPRGRGPLESMRLKLWLVSEVACSLRRHYLSCGQPLLNLSNRSVAIKMSHAGSQVPALWALEVGLVGSAATSPVSLPDVKSELYSPPISLEPLYASRRLQSAKLTFGELRQGSLEVLACERKESAGGSVVTYQLEACLEDASLREQEICGADVFQVFLPEDLGLGASGELMATPSGQAKDNGRTIVTAQAPAVPKAWSAGISEKKPVRLESINYALYPSYHLGCDLVGLGLLLYRALVINDRQSLAAVRSQIESMENSLASDQAAHTVDVRAWVNDWLERQASGDSEDQALGKRQVLYHAIDRMEARAGSIPDSLWQQCLGVGLRLVTNIEGFSFCESAGGPPAEGAVAVLDQVIGQLHELLGQIDVILFDQGPRNQEIRSVIEEVLKEEQGE